MTLERVYGPCTTQRLKQEMVYDANFTAHLALEARVSSGNYGNA